MLPMPCEECERCRHMREFRRRKRCAHESPEVVTDARGRTCLTFEPRTHEDWAALVYGNEGVVIDGR